MFSVGGFSQGRDLTPSETLNISHMCIRTVRNPWISHVSRSTPCCCKTGSRYHCNRAHTRTNIHDCVNLDTSTRTAQNLWPQHIYMSTLVFLGAKFYVQGHVLYGLHASMYNSRRLFLCMHVIRNLGIDCMIVNIQREADHGYQSKHDVSFPSENHTIRRKIHQGYTQAADYAPIGNLICETSHICVGSSPTSKLGDIRQANRGSGFSFQAADYDYNLGSVLEVNTTFRVFQSWVDNRTVSRDQRSVRRGHEGPHTALQDHNTNAHVRRGDAFRARYGVDSPILPDSTVKASGHINACCLLYVNSMHTIRKRVHCVHRIYSGCMHCIKVNAQRIVEHV